MVTMEPEDPREWEVTVNRRKCPAVYYPANIVGCKLLPHAPTMLIPKLIHIGAPNVTLLEWIISTSNLKGC